MSVWGQLDELIAAGAAFALLSRISFRYSLAIDQEWLTFTQEVKRTQGRHVLEGVDLPRTVIRAVVEGWPDDWDQHASRPCSVSLSGDRIPHIALSA